MQTFVPGKAKSSNGQTPTRLPVPFSLHFQAASPARIFPNTSGKESDPVAALGGPLSVRSPALAPACECAHSASIAKRSSSPQLPTPAWQTCHDCLRQSPSGCLCMIGRCAGLPGSLHACEHGIESMKSIKSTFSHGGDPVACLMYPDHNHQISKIQ